jgi:capsular polysaccharide biosynthesis protein
MRYIKLIVISALVFFAMACVVAFFIPSHIRVFRMTSLANNRDSVLNQVRDLSQWKKWYPGFENVVLSNELVKDGRVVKATANGINLAISESTDRSVVVSMQKGSSPIISGWQINKDQPNDSLALQGYMDFQLKWYPWEKFSSLMLDKSYGDFITRGLNELKK